jgi:hypothetical protein
MVKWSTLPNMMQAHRRRLSGCFAIRASEVGQRARRKFDPASGNSAAAMLLCAAQSPAVAWQAISTLP